MGSKFENAFPPQSTDDMLEIVIGDWERVTANACTLQRDKMNANRYKLIVNYAANRPKINEFTPKDYYVLTVEDSELSITIDTNPYQQ